ncbi:MAG: hypothetical protein J6S67_22725 [Methanobrevibacter sp.]|nr:hypothetical protein [Methanobrevibacter sp.]
MANIVFLSWNNYLNRAYRKEDTVSSYISKVSNYIVQSDINFNPGDGVNTTLVVGKGSGAFLDWEKASPNYLVVFEGSGDGTTGNKILTRWYILDADRTRSGQYTLTLKRDIIADMLDSTKANLIPAQIRKGIITDQDSPFLLNRETDVLVNQIKSPNEILLKDQTQAPWLVLYLKKGVLGSGSAQDVVTIPPEFSTADITISVPIEQWSYYQYRDTDALFSDRYTFAAGYTREMANGDHSYTASYIYTVSNTNEYIRSQYGATKYVGPGQLLGTNLDYPGPDVLTSLDYSFGQRSSSMISKARIAYGLISNSDYNNLVSYDGKVIQDSAGKFWQVNLVAVRTEADKLFHCDATNQTSLYDDMKAAWNSGTAQSANPNNSAFGVALNLVHYRLTFTELPDQSITIDLGNCPLSTEDSPLFDAICMPYGHLHYTNPGEYLYGYDTSAVRAMQIMNAIATQLTSAKAFDLQLLPYCPINFPVGSSGDFTDIGAYIFENVDPVTLFISDSTKLGVRAGQDIVYVAKQANITFNIPVNIDSSVYNYANGITDNCEKIKYVNDCTSMRLCSPNYAGLFEFNLAKNGMFIDLFNVDMTLRPFNPYIHVNPNFSKLYGQDTNDCRGLICGGDFSLGSLDSAWAQYELQNRNYQALFDRQIQNLDVSQNIQMMQQEATAVMGTIQGAAGGAAAGMQMGGGWGAVAGMVVGGVTSAAGGMVDTALLARAQQEQKSYMKDNFALHLGNVRALPNTITKTSALTYNNKLWPFIELYECTSQEKDAYLNKIKYDGMTVGIIDILGHWTTFDSNIGNLHYLQGRIVRNGNVIQIENHELEDLNNELMKGVYI